MYLDRVPVNFARIRSVCDKQNITEPTHVFNLNECSFSVKGMTWGCRVKRVVSVRYTAYFRTLNWKFDIDHVTLIAVVNAAGQEFSSAIVIPGVLSRYRRRANGG